MFLFRKYLFFILFCEQARFKIVKLDSRLLDKILDVLNTQVTLPREDIRYSTVKGIWNISGKKLANSIHMIFYLVIRIPLANLKKTHGSGSPRELSRDP